MKLVNSSGYDYQANLFRNAIDNECMDIWQRGTSLMVTDMSFGPDRWCILLPDGVTARVEKDASMHCSALKIASIEPIDVGIFQIMDTVDSKKFTGLGASVSFAASGTGEMVGSAILRWTGTPNAPFLDPITNWSSLSLEEGWYMASDHVSLSPLEEEWKTVIPDGATVVGDNRNIAVLIFGQQITELCITHVQMYLGDSDMPFSPTPYYDELLNCMRYFEVTKYPALSGFFPYQSLKSMLPDIELDDPDIEIVSVYTHGFVVSGVTREFTATITSEIGG